MSTRPLSSLVLLVFLLSGTVVLAPEAHAAFVEDCSNCVDDDADGLVDRNDTGDCPVRADGMFQGIGDATVGKAVLKCHRALAKAGLAFINKRLKDLHACADPAFACVQLFGDPDACLRKVKAKCDAKLAAAGPSGDKLVGAILKACGEDKVSHDALGPEKGIGLELEEAACEFEGRGGPDTIATFAACVRSQHTCHTNRILSEALPRANELLTRMGFVPAADFPCLLEGSAGGGQNLGVRAKDAIKCNKAISKASQKVGTVAAKAFQKCLEIGVACLQVKDAAPECIQKAKLKCEKLETSFRDPIKGGLAKIIGSSSKGCAALAPADVEAPAGLGFEAQALRCNDLDVPQGNATLAITCAGVQQLCDAAQMLNREVPRFRELSGLLGIALPGNL